MFLIRIGTVNVNRKGINVHSSLDHFLCEHRFDIAVLPEVDVPMHSSIGWCNVWRSWGRFAALSRPLDGTCRVALVSTVPLRPVELRVQEAAGRCVAALADFRDEGGEITSILVVGVYLQPGNEAEAAGQGEDSALLPSATSISPPSTLRSWSTWIRARCVQVMTANLVWCNSHWPAYAASRYACSSS